ncbi:MAG TPA: STAS domain-containing protein [Desulfuromonadales bacterium]|nr:STAS domain-containing protein [Desulfuromonadales bacterium]
MPINSSSRENGDIVITSGDRLTIENAAEFSRIAREALTTAHVVTVEFEPDVAIDITGIQLICSACRSASAVGKVFTCRGSQPHSLAEIISSSGAERNVACKYNNDSSCFWFGGVP